jgi:glycosyltransferase involved in cell wall biosynthesis
MTVIRLPDDELAVEKRSRIARALHAPVRQGIAYRQRVAECIATVIDSHRPDVIEFPGYRGESVMWLNGQRLLPMVVRFHGFTAGIDAVWKDRVYAARRLQLSWERRELRAADIITVVAEHLAPSVRARFGADHVEVVHNSIDSDRWRKLSALGSQELDAKDVLFAGTLVGRKGIFILLRAASLLRQTGWRGRLVLAGRTMPEFERFVRVRARFGRKLPDWVVHLGICPRERLACLYRDAGACCFPSLIEPLNYTCLEAMACGGLVVGSSKTGMAEMLTETCGLLVPPGDVPGLVMALRLALSMSDAERTRMKEAAQQRVRDRFDYSVIIPELLKVYGETIDSRGARCRPT